MLTHCLLICVENDEMKQTHYDILIKLKKVVVNQIFRLWGLSNILVHTWISYLSDGKIWCISDIYISFVIHGNTFGMTKPSITWFSIHMASITLKWPSNQSSPTVCIIFPLKQTQMRINKNTNCRSNERLLSQQWIKRGHLTCNMLLK